MRRFRTVAARLPLLAWVCAGLAGSLSAEAPEAPAKVADLARSFEDAGDGSFVHHGPGYEAIISDSSIAVAFGDGKTLAIELGTAIPAPGVAGIEALAGRVHDPDRADRPLFAGVRYAGVRAGIDLDVHATDAGLELSLAAPPGAYAGPIGWVVKGLKHDDVAIIVRGGSLVRRPDGSAELSFMGSVARSARIEIAPWRHRPPDADRVRLAIGADGARFLAGRSYGRGGYSAFVAKMAPDDATLVWVSRFPVAPDDHVRAIEPLDDGSVAVLGADEREGWRAALAPDGSSVSLERGLEIEPDSASPVVPSRFGSASRVDAVLPSPTGGTVIAGVTAERRLPGATIVIPLETGDSAFLATEPGPATPRAAGCPGTINFDNTAGTGIWTTATNWDLDRLPNATDDVCIPAGLGVTINSGTNSIRSLTTAATASFHMTAGTLTIAAPSSIGGDATMIGGTWNGAGDVTIAGPFTWSGGTLGGGGTTHANGGIDAGGTFKDLNPRTLHNTGTVSWVTGGFRIGGGSTIQNDGTWDAQGDATLSNLSGGGAFINNGTLRKSAGVGTTTIAASLSSAGSVDVQSGTLSFNLGGSASGAFTGSAGAALRFAGGTMSLEWTSSVNVATTRFDSGTISVAGSYAASAATQVGGGNVTFTSEANVTSVGPALSITSGSANFSSGETIAPATLTISGGELTGSDTVTVSGLVTWSGGAMTGGGATTANGGIAMSGGFKDLNPRVLQNAATATWAGTGGIRLGGGSQIRNTGTWAASGDGSMTALPGSGTFVNDGVFRKTGGAGTTSISVPFTSAGNVEALSNKIEFLSGFTQTAGALTLNGGTVTAAAPLSIQGGTFRGIGATLVGLTSAGTTSPGLSPGILGTTGSWSQSSAGTLAVELGGTTPGAQHDRFDVSGTASIDGTLTATFVGGYAPVTGDTFTILTAGTRSGTFASTTLPSLGPGQFWNVLYKPTSVELKIVPLPSGRVPGDLPSESQLKIAKSGANLKLDWSGGCVATDVDSEIYEGAVGGSFTSHVPVVCTTGGAVTWTLAPSAGNRYYLVVPSNGAGEGSYGFGASGVERPVSPSACRVQALASCP
jgi:phage baseplate assembly protein gpV